jgi:pyridoxal phosphate enzyme (YggS family)
MTIQDNLLNIKTKIEKALMDAGRDKNEARLLAVSKTKPVSAIKDAIKAGQIDFGENYIQEAMDKIDELGRDNITWHFIGRLQSNKAKFAVQYFDLIHSVDSFKLAKEIDKRAKAINKVQKILIQINTGREEQKSGIMPEDAMDVFKDIVNLENIEILGLMSIPPFGMDEKETKIHFKLLKKTLGDLNKNFSNLDMKELSMGMTGDFETAIKEGSTMVRVGTAIFGARA